MGFETLKQAIDPGLALGPLTPEQTKFADEKLSDASALGIVLQDIGYAERYVGSKARPQEWNDVDNLYRAVVQPKTWEGSNQARAHLGMPLILEVVESMLPQIHLGFFSDKTRPFTLIAKGTTTQGAARATGKVLEWGVKQSGFKEEIRKILKSCLLYGTGVGKWGWSISTRKLTKFTREDGDIVATTDEVTHSVPTFEFIELGNLLVDPSVRSHDIRNAKFVIMQKFVTAYELDEMRTDELFKGIPTRDELREILATKSEPASDSMAATKVENFRTLQAERQDSEVSSDPLMQPIEVLEYWTQDRVIVVLGRKIVIRNDENEYDELPFVSCAFIDVLKSFFGLGIGKLLEGEQKLEAGVANMWIDSLNLTMSPAFHRKKGVGPSAQNIFVSPGRVVNDDGELAPLQVPSVTAEALQAIQSSEARGRRRVGANFGPDMPNQAMRTAEGVQEFTSGIQVRTQYFIELFAEFVFVPVLEAFVAMAKNNLTPKDIDNILTEQDGKAFEGDDHLAIYNGQYAIEVLSSTKLAGRRAMATLVPTLMQLFSAAPVQQALITQNKKLDMAEFLEQVIDLTGWDAPGLIVDMTPDDLNRALAQNPQAMRNQGMLQLQQAKHDDDMELESAKGDVRGGLQVVKHILDQSGKHDEAQRGLMSSLLTPPQQQEQASAPLSNQPAPPTPDASPVSQ